MQLHILYGVCSGATTPHSFTLARSRSSKTESAPLPVDLMSYTAFWPGRWTETFKTFSRLIATKAAWIWNAGWEAFERHYSGTLKSIVISATINLFSSWLRQKQSHPFYCLSWTLLCFKCRCQLLPKLSCLTLGICPRERVASMISPASPYGVFFRVA